MREGLLRQPVRRRILHAIKKRPGLKLTDLCEETEAGWGTIQHHVHLLQKAGLVVSKRPGRDRLLFPGDFPAEDLPAAGVLSRGRAGELARAILAAPGARQKDLCRDVKMTRKTLGGYLRLLSDAGLVNARREGPYQRYYPSPPLAEHMERWSAGVAADTVTPKLDEPRGVGGNREH